MNDVTHDQIISLYVSLAFIVALIGLWHCAAELKATARAVTLENRRALLSKAYGAHISISDPRVHRTTRPSHHVANPTPHTHRSLK